VIKLIKNEFIKIFNKKSTYIMFIITILFVIFNNTIYKTIDNIDINNLNKEIVQEKNYYINHYNEYKKDKTALLKDKYTEYDLKLEYADAAINDAKTKYMIKNNVDLDSYANLRYGFINILQDYSIFIIILTVMISGSIVSKEFNKGTIKQLLIRPYSRFKILLSKYITCIIILIISICLILLLETFIGGITFGFKSIDIPVIVYNFDINKTIEVSTLKYTFTLIISTLPKFILLTTLSFTISTIINNSIIGVIIPILGYFISDIINAIAISYKINILKYFITLNWDWSKYLYGGIGLYENINIYFSIFICILYMIIMLVPTFIIFNNKDIKNI